MSARTWPLLQEPESPSSPASRSPRSSRGVDPAYAKVNTGKHFRALLRKNGLLKKRQWSATCCPCCPLAACCELVLPVAIVALLFWAKTQCDGTQCNIPVLAGWGGRMPEGNFSTECVEHLPLIKDGHFIGHSYCSSWTDVFQRPLPFYELLAYLHWSGKHLAIAAQNSEDLEKLEKMREFISTQWHPDMYLFDVPCKNLEHPIFTLDQIKGIQKNPLHPPGSLPCDNLLKLPNPGTLPSFKNLTKMYTTKELQEYLDSTEYGEEVKLYGAIVFNAIGGNGEIGSAGKWDYTIRLNVTAMTAVETMGPYTKPVELKLDMMRANIYLQKGFTSLQLLVDRYIIGLRSETGDASQLLKINDVKLTQYDNPQVVETLAESLRYAPQAVETVPFPVTGVVIDGFYQLIAQVFPLVFIVGFLYTQKSIVNELITEKESKVRESLRMLGVGSLAIFGSWYVTYASIFAVLCGVFTASASISIFPSSSGTLVFVFFWLWSMAFLSCGLFIHSFFNQARTGGIVGVILMFLQWIIYASQNRGGEVASTTVTVVLMLLPNAAFCSGLSMLSAFEASKIGVSWGRLLWPVNNASFLVVLLMLCLDIVLWTFAGWYLDLVLPKEFGARLPANFLCMPSFWRKGHARMENGTVEPHEEHSEDVPAICVARDTVEAVPAAVRSRSLASGSLVRTVGLRREFSTPGGTKVAVAGLDITMYEGQVLACLGHNGAGKSTTINMLTGMVAPTAGDAFVAGYSVLNQMQQIRQIIGVCPQHDVLWLELTVIEHLRIYARIRGVPTSDINTRAGEMMQAVGLTEKALTRAGSLSGGQKRKLSLCLALIGKPCVVFLDEPTSGMDPFSRRSTWNIIRGAREGRVTVLTTHFMDEADILGDRIAIMAEGELQCCGSSLFLKNRFGAGYRITCARKKCKSAENGEDAADVIRRHIVDADILTNVGGELSMRLPTTAAAKFPALFEELDGSMEKLGLEQYGLSMVTLEEVFLCIAGGNMSRIDRQLSGRSFEEEYGLGERALRDADVADVADALPEAVAAGPRQDQAIENDAESGRMQNEARVVARHLVTLFMKRARYGRRDFKSMFCMVFLPVGWLALGLWMITSFASRHYPPAALSMEAQYGAQHPVPYNATSSSVWADPSRFFSEVEQVEPRPESIPQGMGNGSYFGRHYANGTPTFIPCENIPKIGIVSKCWREENICSHIKSTMFAVRKLGVDFGCQTNSTTCKATINAFCAKDSSQCVLLCSSPAISGNAPDVKPSSETLKKCAEQCANLCQRAENVTFACDFLDDPFSGRHHKIAALCPVTCASNNNPDTCNYGTSCLEQNHKHALDPEGTLGFQLQLYQEGQGSERATSTYGAVKMVSQEATGTTVTLLFNTTANHIVPTLLNLVTTSLKRAVSGGDSSISTSTHPFPEILHSEVSQVVSAAVNLFATLVIIEAFAFIPATMVAYVVREREAHHNSKHQQLLSGVNVISYWVANLLWDLSVYMIPMGLSLLVIWLEDIHVFIQNGAFQATLCIFFGYGLAIAPFAYLLSFLFSKHTTAQVICLVANFMTGLLLVLVSYILDAIDSTKDANAKLMWLFRLFPGFSLGHGMLQVCTYSLISEFTSSLGYKSMDLLKWDIAGKDVLYLYATAPLYFALSITVDYLLHSPMAAMTRHLDPRCVIPEQDEDDEDVKAETSRVANGEADDALVRLVNLQKVYRTPEGQPKVAVHGLSFGISRGECFGFLGINGAGKTSTLNMLTGAILPSGGAAFLGGFDVVHEQWKVRRLLGYCPQHDALLDRLTVREHLQLFGRIKGIPPRALREYCDAMMKNLDLYSHVDKQAMTLSGGNKRKLSLAISMMGSPPMVFLDEPSTGVDPAARRLMWNVIAEVTTVKNTSSVVLTTHNMEEAEALCTRIGIMVGGRLRCIGSNQHLKARFSTGYQMEARLKCLGVDEVRDAVAAWKLPDVVTQSNVPSLCERLGCAERAALVREGCEEGYLVYDALARGGSVPASIFAEWWLLEDRAGRLGDFLRNSFPGTEALERHDRTLRFRLPAACSLAKVFRSLEASRAELSLEDYGISQTSLEQIFNEFASRQQEETGPVQGLFVAGRTVSDVGSVEMGPAAVP